MRQTIKSLETEIRRIREEHEHRIRYLKEDHTTQLANARKLVEARDVELQLQRRKYDGLQHEAARETREVAMKYATAREEIAFLRELLRRMPGVAQPA